MTKEEFVKYVMEIIESGQMEKLDELVGNGLNHPEIQTVGRQMVTVTWGTQ